MSMSLDAQARSPRRKVAVLGPIPGDQVITHAGEEFGRHTAHREPSDAYQRRLGRRVDFDAVLRDPADPTQLIVDLRRDCYHPNAAGDALLRSSIPLSVFGERAQRRSSDALGSPAVVGLEGT